MFVLVTGPESSGTRWVSTLCAAALGVEGHETWNGNEQIHDFTNAVMHRSLPHGTRTGFLNISKIVDEMTPRYGGQGRIIVCIRDQTCVHHSCNREHNHNDELTRVNMCKAADICRHLLDDPRAMLFSYETAMFLKDRYVKILLDWLGTKTLTSVTYIDGNCKYFLPNSAETAKSADEVRHTQADQISANSAETAKSADEVRHTQADRISANSAKNSNKEKPVNSTLLIRRLRPNFPRRARPYL